MNSKAILLASASACVAVSLFIATNAHSERFAIDHTIARARSEIAALASRQSEIERLSTLIKERERDLTRLHDEARLEVQATTPPKRSETSNLFDTWLIRIDNLATFLSQHKSLQIPELEYLKANDWLEATITESLETEADYRSAAARLRQLAKRKTAPAIAAALAAYLEASGGELPTSPRDLVSNLHGSVSPEVLNRYRVNPSGLVDGRHTGMTHVLIEDQRVDPIWYSRFSFPKQPGSYAMFGVPNISPVAEAIAAFQAENGRPPANSDELAPFVRSKTLRENLPEIMRAMATPVSYP